MDIIAARQHFAVIDNEKLPKYLIYNKKDG